MQDHDTTSGSNQPDVEVEKVLDEVQNQPLTLNGCLHVVPVELPAVLGPMHPICSRITSFGEHPLPSRYVLKDLDTNEVYCHIRCAAEESIDRAISIARDEGLYPEVTRD